MPIHPAAPIRRENSGEKPLIQPSSAIAEDGGMASARNARISSRTRASAGEKAKCMRRRYPTRRAAVNDAGGSIVPAATTSGALAAERSDVVRDQHGARA